MSTTITHKRLISAFKKAGFTVENLPRFSRGDEKSNSWMVKNAKGKSLEWHTQAGFVPAKDGVPAHHDESNPITTYLVKRSPHTDIMTDLFCDSFFHTIKEVVRELSK